MLTFGANRHHALLRGDALRRDAFRRDVLRSGSAVSVPSPACVGVRLSRRRRSRCWSRRALPATVILGAGQDRCNRGGCEGRREECAR